MHFLFRVTQGISNLSAHHKTVLRRKLVDTPAQQSVKQANGAFGQVIAKTAQEFGLSLGLIRRQSQRVKSADLTAFFSQYAICAHTLSNDGAHVFLCLDPIFASALIEVQTISFVTGTACVDRTPSITDRALISPFLVPIVGSMCACRCSATDRGASTI